MDLPGRMFSRDDGSAPDTPEAGALCRSSNPLSGRSDSRVIVLCFRATQIQHISPNVNLRKQYCTHVLNGVV